METVRQLAREAAAYREVQVIPPGSSPPRSGFVDVVQPEVDPWRGHPATELAASQAVAPTASASSKHRTAIDDTDRATRTWERQAAARDDTLHHGLTDPGGDWLITSDPDEELATGVENDWAMEPE